MHTKLSLLIFLLFGFTLVSLAQKTSKIYFDKNWHVTRNVKDAEYYRIINFDAANKPIGNVNDFYINGKLQNEALKSYVDTIDPRNDTTVGMSRWYAKNGQMTREVNYVQGKRDGEMKEWYDSGVLKSIRQYKNGVLEGEMTSYYENGNYKYRMNYQNGAIVNKKGIYYNSYSRKMEGFFESFHQEIDPYGWILPDKTQATASIAKDTGLYIHNISKKDIVAYLDLPFNGLGGMSYTIYVKKEAGPPEKGYGLIYDYKDENNYSYFLVRSDGHFLAGRKLNGAETEKSEWKKTKHLLGNDKVDRLSISRRGPEMHFYINGKDVFTGRYYPFTSTNYGVICAEEVTILLDNLSIYQW